MAFTLTSRWKTQKTQHCYNQLTCARAHVRASMQVPEVHTEWFLNHFPHYFVRQGLLTNLVLTDSVGFTGQWALGLPTPGWHHICFLHKYLESELGFSGLCSKSFINEVTSPATNFFFSWQLYSYHSIQMSVLALLFTESIHTLPDQRDLSIENLQIKIIFHR